MTSGGPPRGWDPSDDPEDRSGNHARDPDEGLTQEEAQSREGAPGISPLPRLAPMPIMGVFEVAGRIIRRHAGPLLAVSALFQLPSSLVDAAAQQRLGGALAPLVAGLDSDAPRFLEPTRAQAQAILEALLVVVGTSVIGTLLGALATLAFTTAVLTDYQGRVPTLGAMVSVALRRALPALAAGLVASLALLGVVVGAVALTTGALTALPTPAGGTGGPGVFLALVIGVSAVVLAVVVIVRLALPAAVLAGEPVGPIEALRRSWSLTAGHTWRAFAVLGIMALVMTIIGTTLLEVLAAILTEGLARGVGLADASDALLSGLVSTLLAPVGGVVLAVLYLDLRVRHDGWQPVVASTRAGAQP